jgi:hypothetical protein
MLEIYMLVTGREESNIIWKEHSAAMFSFASSVGLSLGHYARTAETCRGLHHAA